MENKQTKIAIVLVIVTIVVVCVSFFTSKKEEKEEEKTIEIVTNYSNFYTVNSCLYRVTTYLLSENKDDMYLVLSDDYKKKNKITVENVLDVFPNIKENSTFDSRKMYYEVIDENINKYYVEGVFTKNQMFDDNVEIDLSEEKSYFIVYIDIEKNIFTVEPYDGEIFIGGALDEK